VRAEERLQPGVGHHLHADHHEHQGSGELQVPGTGRSSGEGEVEAAQAEDAKTLLVKTRNGSAVIAKMAGIESTAKMRSVNSTITSARKSGVARRTPIKLHRGESSLGPGPDASRHAWPLE